MLRPGPGNKKAFKSVRDAPEITRRAIRQAFFRSGRQHMAELSQQMLARDKEGRIYIRRGPKGGRRQHRASAPGQTAANRSGNMRRGRGFQLSGVDQMEFGIRGAPYAAFLERGTKNIKPRPSLGNTVNAMQKNTHNNFVDSMKRELR